MIILRRIFLETLVLRRINLRRIILEFNFSEEDISGNDSSEKDKSKENISRNNGSEEDVCEEDLLKERLLGRFCQKWWPVWVDILIVDYNYLFQILTCFKEHINILQVDINKIDSMVFHKLVYSGNINYRMYLSKNNVWLKGCLIKLFSIFSAFVNY